MKKFVSLAVILLAAFNISAQWTNNTLVNTAVSDSNSGFFVSKSTSSGKTWVAFYKSVPNPVYFELRAQLLDKDGVKLLGPEGVLVSNAENSTWAATFSTIVDNNDNLIVAFTPTSTLPTSLIVNKVSPSGTLLWGSAGIIFPNASSPRLGIINNNDIILSWDAGTRASMQRLAAADGAPIWPSPINVLPLVSTNRTQSGQIVPLSDNGFIHIFNVPAASFGPYARLWAQRYNANGASIWAAPVQLASSRTLANLEYSIAVYRDTVFIAYPGSPGGARTDCYFQRLNPDGTVPWGLNGSDFATNNLVYESDAKMVLDSTTKVAWVCSRVTNTQQTMQGTYVQKFNLQTGARLLTDNGKMIFPISPLPNMTHVNIDLFSDNSPLLMLIKTNITSISGNVYATKLNPNDGSFVWANDTIPLGTFDADKIWPSITKLVNDQAVATWVEDKGTGVGYQPFAQPIRIDGRTGLSAPVAGFSASSLSICRNASIQFSSTSTGFISIYSWSFPGGSPSTSSSANPQVSYNTNGVYPVTLTVTNSGGSNTLTMASYITVTSVTPTLVLTGSTSACAGQAGNFKVTGTNLGTATSYYWKLDGNTINIGTDSNFTISTLNPGTYQIKCEVTSNALCAMPATVLSNTLNFTVKPTPQISFVSIPSMVCNSDTPFVLNALPSGGIFSGAAIINGNTFNPSSVVQNGASNFSYNVSVDGCTSSLNGSIFVKDCPERHLTINRDPALILQKNPTTGIFSIRVNTDMYKSLNFRLFNKLGQELKIYNKQGLSYGSVIPFDISNLPVGIYNLYIYSEQNGGKTKTFRIVKYL